MLQYDLHILLAIPALITTVVTALVVWRSRSLPAGRALLILLAAVTGMLVCDLLASVSHELFFTLFFAKLQAFFTSALPLAWLYFALAYTGRQKSTRPKIFWVLLIIPLITNILVWTNDLHHLIWQSASLTPLDIGLVLTVNTFGSWFWVSTIYTDLLLIAGAVLILLEYFSPNKLYRQQSIWITSGVLAPMLVNLLYISHIFPAWSKDFSAVAVGLGTAVYAIGVFRYHLFDLVPIARTALIDKMDDGMVVLDPQKRIIDINPAARQIFELSGKKAIGSFLALPAKVFPAGLANHEMVRRQRDIELNPTGPHRFFDIRTAVLNDPHGRMIGYLITLHDVTSRKLLMQKVETMANTDSATGIFNRRHFYTLALKSLSAQTSTPDQIACLLIDLDHFKDINDTYGHQSGDYVIQKTSQLLQEALRDGDILARYGGDEFIILLPKTGLAPAVQIANRLLNTLEETTFQVRDASIHTSASLGVSASQTDEINLDRLIEQADRALYRAKKQGRRQVAAFEE